MPGSDREKGAVAIWMDCVDDSEPVPVWQNSIIAKVTRISLEDDDVDYVGGEVFTRAESNNVSIASGNRPLTANPSADDSLLGDAFDEPLAPAPSANSSSNSLLDDHLPAHNLGGSLLDMDHLGASATSAKSTTASVHHDDFLNMMAAPAPTQPQPTHPSQGGAMPAQHRPQPMQQPMQQQPMQHGRPTQQMGGQYPVQYPPQGQYAGQGMSQMPTPQQMQQQQQQQRNMQNGAQQQRSMQNGANGQKMSMSGNTLDPLGGLNWNMK